MASTFEPKIADDSLERVEVFKAQACCAFAIIVRECPWIPNAGKFSVIHKPSVPWILFRNAFRGLVFLKMIGFLADLDE